MQNNVEDIFDGFIQHKLNEFVPDVTLLHSSCSSFLAERQKKKKRRFFWLFFTLLFIVSLFSYYFLAFETLQTDKSPNTKSNTPVQRDNVTLEKYSTKGEISSMPKGNSIKNTTFIDSLSLQPLDRKPNGTLQDGNKNKADKKMDNANIGTNTTTNKYTVDSLLLFIKIRPDSYSPNNDSIRKKIIKTVVDTFFIVW